MYINIYNVKVGSFLSKPKGVCLTKLPINPKTVKLTKCIKIIDDRMVDIDSLEAYQRPNNVQSANCMDLYVLEEELCNTHFLSLIEKIKLLRKASSVQKRLTRQRKYN